MAGGLHTRAARVQALLETARSPARVVELPTSTHTAAEAAAALGVGVEEIAKSLVFLADGVPVVAVLSGADRLDEERLGCHLGASEVARASPEQVREATGYPVGGVSPLGLPEGVGVVLDRRLGDHDRVWAAAGTPHAVFPTALRELAELSGGDEADVAVRAP